jgi:hypothetical protein
VLDKPDEGSYFSSGSGVGFGGRFDKPDANQELESCIGTGLLALCVGFVGLGRRGKRVYEVETHSLSRISPYIIVMTVITVMRARKPLT